MIIYHCEALFAVKNYYFCLFCEKKTKPDAGHPVCSLAIELGHEFGQEMGRSMGLEFFLVAAHLFFEFVHEEVNGMVHVAMLGVGMQGVA